MKNKTIASLSLRKLLLSVLVTAPLATLPVPLWALPGTQSALDATISSKSTGVTVTSNSATSATVTSTSQYGIVRWIDFGGGAMTIGSGDTVTYNMPSSSSAVLNTVTGTNATIINGTLTTGANGGSIWVQNPNGITVGSTGVINATNIGLSTVPESEFYFASNGRLQLVENTTNTSGIIPTSKGVMIDGATLTAASGTGNVWIAGKGVAASGTIDAGNVTITGFQGGTITLAPGAGVAVAGTFGAGTGNTTTGGALTIGDVTNLNSTLTVNQTTAGQIAIDANQNLTVYGPSVSLNAGGNATITQASGSGQITIGNGGTNGATLTLNSGSQDTTISKVLSAGTGVLSVTATGGNISIIDPSSTGKLAVSGTGTSLTAITGGDLTINAGNVSTALTATSNNGSILSGGTMILGSTGNIALTANTAGKNITFHEASAGTGGQTFAVSSNATGSVTVTADAGTIVLPAVPASAVKNITVTAGNITTPDNAAVSATGGTLSLTATAGNVNIGTTGNSTLSGSNVTIWASDSVKSAAGDSITSAGKVSVTGSAGNVDTTNLSISGGPTDVTLVAGKALTIGSAITGGNVTATAGTTLTDGATIDSAGAVALSATGDLGVSAAIGGTTAPASVTLTSNSGNITIGSNITSASAGTISATAGGFVTNNATLSAPSGSVNLTGTAGNVTTGAISSGNITLTAGGLVFINNTQTATKKLVASGASINDSGAITAAAPGTTDVSLTSTSGNVTIANTVGSGGNFAGNVTVSSAGKIDVNANINSVTSTSLTATGNVNLAGSIVTAPTLNITGAYINESGGSVILSTGTATLNSTSSISLATATNDFNKLIVIGASSDAAITEANGLTLGNGTNVSGNLTITAGGAVALGAAAADTIVVGKALGITTTSGGITEASNNVSVTGAVNLNSAGAITLDGATHNGVGLNSHYGAINIAATGGDVSLFESSTLNLGNVTLGAHNLNAYSATSIVNTGVISQNASQTITVGAGTATSPGTINLDFVDSTSGNGNQILGTVIVNTDLGLLGFSTGTYLASNVTIVNDAAASTLFKLTPQTTGSTSPNVNVSLSTLHGNALNVGRIVTTGSVSLTSATGTITATDPNNNFGAVTVKSGGTVSVSNSGALTVNGNISGTGTATYTAATGDLTIGSYVSGSTAAQSFVATAGNVTDSVPGISIYGPVSFSGKSVSVTKAGHSFGPVSITTSGNGNAAIVESGYLNLGTINTGSGSFTASSTNGGILQTGTITAGNVTVSALQGTVALTGTNSISGWISSTASGNTTLANNAAISLGNVTTASGNLSIDTLTSNGNITQATGTSVYAYGPVSMHAGTGAITVNNTGNQFGGLSLMADGAITIKEWTTLNLAKVSNGAGTGAAASLTASSEAGSIVDSQAADGAINVAGTATLTASNVNISAKKATIATVVGNATGGDFTLKTGGALNATVTASGNATITAGGALTLSGATVGGDFTATATSSTITQTGALHLTGNVTLWGTAFTLNDPTNTFGAVQLHNSSAALVTSITEATTFNLRAGSVSQGQVVITTGGNFITSGTGGSSFLYNSGSPSATTAGLIVHAPNGTITFGSGSVVVTGGLTVDSSGTKDLTQLSLAGNLSGITPFNQGTGTLVGPSTP